MVTSWQDMCESIKESIRTLKNGSTLGMDTVSVLDLLVMRLMSLY